MNTEIVNVLGKQIKIVVVQECPPIPYRNFDWCAYEDGCEEDRHYGNGATRSEAIADLIDILSER